MGNSPTTKHQWKSIGHWIGVFSWVLNPNKQKEVENMKERMYKTVILDVDGLKAHLETKEAKIVLEHYGVTVTDELLFHLNNYIMNLVALYGKEVR